MNGRQFAEMWARHSAEWRDSAQICSQWRDAAETDPRLLECRASKDWWGIIADLGITLLITREYEHLTMALSTVQERPRISFFPLPHPSGLVADRASGRVVLASTRNPNQLFTFKPADGMLVPVASLFFPGSLYLHDLALIGSSIYANAVGHNAVVRFGAEGVYEHVWWPKAIERRGQPVFGRNYIQLNSIAAGKTLRTSYFTASSAAMGRIRPGDPDYKVDGAGVVFSGRTREPVCTGLTRPHSARLKDGKEGNVWLDNSGYGELGFVAGGGLEVVARLPGWTRGLCLIGDVAFVGTSRIIPGFEKYAPGLKAAAARCAVHAVSLRSGKTLGSLEWPAGNQIFAIDWIAADSSIGFPFEVRRKRKRELKFFYNYAAG